MYTCIYIHNLKIKKFLCYKFDYSYKSHQIITLYTYAKNNLAHITILILVFNSSY